VLEQTPLLHPDEPGLVSLKHNFHSYLLVIGLGRVMWLNSGQWDLGQCLPESSGKMLLSDKRKTLEEKFWSFSFFIRRLGRMWGLESW
jgi:hypothetical protein